MASVSDPPPHPTGTILAWSIVLLPSRDIISTQTVTRRLTFRVNQSDRLHSGVNIEMKESQLLGDALCDVRDSLQVVHLPSMGIREAMDLLVSLNADLQASPVSSE